MFTRAGSPFAKQGLFSVNNQPTKVCQVLHYQLQDTVPTCEISSNNQPTKVCQVLHYQLQDTVPTCEISRMSSGNRTSSKICKSVPSFCTVYIVSKDGLSSVYAPVSESDLTSTSRVPKGNGSSSSIEVFSDGTSSISDLNDNSSEWGLSGFPSLPRSNLASKNLESSSSDERHGSFTLYDYLAGAASVYKELKTMPEELPHALVLKALSQVNCRVRTRYQ